MRWRLGRHHKAWLISDNVRNARTAVEPKAGDFHAKGKVPHDLSTSGRGNFRYGGGNDTALRSDHQLETT